MRNIDPCNFASVARKRRAIAEQLWALAGGLHPRLGAASPFSLITADLLENNIQPFLRNPANLNQGCCGEVRLSSFLR